MESDKVQRMRISAIKVVNIISYKFDESYSSYKVVSTPKSRESS